METALMVGTAETLHHRRSACQRVGRRHVRRLRSVVWRRAGDRRQGDESRRRSRRADGARGASSPRRGAAWRRRSADASCSAIAQALARSRRRAGDAREPRQRQAAARRRGPTCRSPRATSSSSPASPTRSWATRFRSARGSSTSRSASRSACRRRSCRGTIRSRSARAASRRRWPPAAPSC